MAYKQVPNKNKELIHKIKEVARKKPRYGYRRVWAVLKDEFSSLNIKRVHRLWKLENLSLKSKPKRRRLGVSQASSLARYPGHVWSMDFAYDRCENGTKFRTFCVLDEYTRESLAIEVATSIHSKKVIQVLKGLFL